MYLERDYIKFLFDNNWTVDSYILYQVLVIQNFTLQILNAYDLHAKKNCEKFCNRKKTTESPFKRM